MFGTIWGQLRDHVETNLYVYYHFHKKYEFVVFLCVFQFVCLVAVFVYLAGDGDGYEGEEELWDHFRTIWGTC